MNLFFASLKVRTFAFAAAISLTALGTGCSSSDDGGGSSGAVASCKTYCDAQGKGDGCPAKTAADCRDMCDAFASSFTGDCAAKAETYFACAKGQHWKCMGEVAFTSDATCDAESDAYTKACFSKK
jgi:hypothetical protein